MEAGWYPDPTGRYEQRLWNGARWTSQVHADGRVTTDPFERPAPPAEEAPAPVEPPRRAPPFLAGMREVHVRQRRDVGRNVYDYLDADGRRVGIARQVRQPKAARVLRLVAKTYTSMGRHEYDVHDADRRHVLTLLRPATFGGAPMRVMRPDRLVLGDIAPRAGGAFFGLTARGEVVGRVHKARRDQMVDFEITDAAGAAVARLHKVFRGIVTELVTYADSYTLTLVRPMEEPLRTLVVVTPLALDETWFQW